VRNGRGVGVVICYCQYRIGLYCIPLIGFLSSDARFVLVHCSPLMAVKFPAQQGTLLRSGVACAEGPRGHSTARLERKEGPKEGFSMKTRGTNYLVVLLVSLSVCVCALWVVLASVQGMRDTSSRWVTE